MNLRVIERNPASDSDVPIDFELTTSVSDNDNMSGLSVVDDVYYTVDSSDNAMYLHKRDPADTSYTI